MAKGKKSVSGEEQGKPLDYTRGQVEKKETLPPEKKAKVPSAPPKGYGAAPEHSCSPEEQVYLQKCWERETPERRKQIVEQTAHLNP